MRVLPFLYSEKPLSILNWVALGAAGALMSVLQNLRNSDVTEVGNTEGRKEIWRTVSGGALGLMAGALAYAAVAAGIFGKSLAPVLDSNLPLNIGLAIIWAIAAGLLVDRVVDKILTQVKAQ